MMGRAVHARLPSVCSPGDGLCSIQPWGRGRLTSDRRAYHATARKLPSPGGGVGREGARPVARCLPHEGASHRPRRGNL
jgi:hypothetical protein